MTGPDSNSDQPVASALAGVLRVKSGFIAVVCLVITAIAYFILLHVRDIAATHDIELTRLTEVFLESPWLIVVAAVPAVASALAGAAARRRVWVWLTLTTMLLLIPVGILLYCFVQVVGSMYQYQQL